MWIIWYQNIKKGTSKQNVLIKYSHNLKISQNEDFRTFSTKEKTLCQVTASTNLKKRDKHFWPIMPPTMESNNMSWPNMLSFFLTN